MKRLLRVVLVAAMLGTSAPIVVAPATALAAAAACGGDNPGKGACKGSYIPSDPCVNIALPIFTGDKTCVDNTGGGGAVVNYLRTVLKLLSGLVGTIIVLMLVIAGIQYIVSSGDQNNIKSAKKRIQNALTALVLFLFMVGILQFLVPGGIL